jgi:hypothetical protein
MAHDVFICYSSRDKAIADAACAALESRKIRCWIAPRDVPPGQPWAGALVRAIDESRILVLVFSSESNSSPQVIREVERAADRGLPIIPLRVEDAQPSQDMEFFIKRLHWLDAVTPPLEGHLQRLCDTVQALLAGEMVGRPETVRPVGVAAAEGARSAADAQRPPARKGIRWRIWAPCAISAILLAMLTLCGVGAVVWAGRPLLAKLGDLAAAPRPRTVAVETAVATLTPAATTTEADTPTATASETASATPTGTPTATLTASPTATQTPQPTATAPLTLTQAATPVPATASVKATATPVPVVTVVLGPVDQVPADWVRSNDPDVGFTLRHPPDWTAENQDGEPGTATFSFGPGNYVVFRIGDASMGNTIGDKDVLDKMYVTMAASQKKQGFPSTLVSWGSWSSPIRANFIEMTASEAVYYLEVVAVLDADHYAIVVMQRLGLSTFGPYSQADYETLARVLASIRLR